MLIEIRIENHYWHVPICIPEKCEAGIFAELWSAYVHARALKYLDTPILHRAHVPCMHVHVTHAQCDVPRVYIQCELHHHDIIGICIPFVQHRNDVA